MVLHWYMAVLYASLHEYVMLSRVSSWTSPATTLLDLVNSKGNPLVSIKPVWKWFPQHCVQIADTSIIIMSTEYTAHFFDNHIDGEGLMGPGVCFSQQLF